MKFSFEVLLLSVLALGIPLNTALNVEKRDLATATGSLDDQAGGGHNDN